MFYVMDNGVCEGFIILVCIFNSRNVEFGLRDLDLVFRMGILPWVRTNPKPYNGAKLVVAGSCRNL
jgi:hypothetical protein